MRRLLQQLLLVLLEEAEVDDGEVGDEEAAVAEGRDFSDLYVLGASLIIRASSYYYY